MWTQAHVVQELYLVQVLSPFFPTLDFQVDYWESWIWLYFEDARWYDNTLLYAFKGPVQWKLEVYTPRETLHSPKLNTSLS